MKKISLVTASLALIFSVSIDADDTTNNPGPSSGGLLQQINNGIAQIQADVSNGFDAINQMSQNFSLYISQLISSGVQTSASLMFTLSPDLQTTMSTSYSQGVAAPLAAGQAFAVTNAQLNQVFSATPQNLQALTQVNALANNIPLPGALATINSSNNNANGNINVNTQNLAFAPFNVGSLLIPDVYSTATEQKNAQNFINYLSYQSVPYVNLPTNFFANDLPAVQAYRAFLGTYAALQSIGLDNLNELYTQRQPLSGLGTLAGLPHRSDASVQQVEHHMVVARGLNPNWYAQMENAPTATIQRETLYTLAAIQVELYNNNQLLQRMLTTQSAMELTQNQTQIRPKLTKMANDVKNLVQKNQATGQQYNIAGKTVNTDQ